MAVQLSKNSTTQALSITPLIDVVFLLLIFFLITTRFEEKDSKLDLDLPSASEAQSITDRPQDIEISIDRRGLIYVDGKETSEDRMEALLTEKMTDNPLTQSVIIRGDENGAYGKFVTVMNVCERVGIPINQIATSND